MAKATSLALWLVASVALIWSAPAARAEDVRPAFAAAQAPEQAYATCRGATAEKAGACALNKCRESGAEDCTLMAACASGWAGSVGIRLEEIHFTDTVCGAPSKQAVIDALVAFCRGHLPQVQECFIAEVWSPDGTSMNIERTLTRKQIKSKTLP